MINLGEYNYDGVLDYNQEKNIIWFSIIVDNDAINDTLTIINNRTNLQTIVVNEDYYYGYNDIFMLNIIRKYDTDQTPSIETGKSEILVGVKQPSFNVEQYNALLAQIEELENCILEMSEVIYGDEGDAV